MESVDFEENTLITNGPVDQAIKYWAPADTTNQTANLMGLLEAEWRLAQAIDLNDTGQAYGQRTSASEVLRINNAAPVSSGSSGAGTPGRFRATYRHTHPRRLCSP